MDLHSLRSLRLVPQLLMSAQRGVVLIPQRPIQTVTQTNVGCTSKKILPAWLPWEEFMRDPQPFTTSLCCMIKGRLVLRRLKMQMLLVPTDKVILVGQALNTFLAWPTHLVKRLSEQVFLLSLYVFFN